MASKSTPFSEAVDSLQKKFGVDSRDSSGVDGASLFINELLEHRSELFVDETECVIHSVCDKVRADGLSLVPLKGDSSSRKELYTLYIRAFQSIHDKKHLREFVAAIDKRLTTGPVDLERIDPQWCTPEHNLYMHCWRRLTATANKETQLARDAKIGRSLFDMFVKGIKTQDSSGASVDIMQKLEVPIRNFRSHNATMALWRRVFCFLSKEENSDLFDKTLVNTQLCMQTVDLAKLARDGIRIAQKLGIKNPQEQLMKLTSVFGGRGKGWRKKKQRR